MRGRSGEFEVKTDGYRCFSRWGLWIKEEFSNGKIWVEAAIAPSRMRIFWGWINVGLMEK
ncbi:hypothetical protein J0895_15970 [Phormidium pseudopriestleyi FRX01]|uniref:Transposase n=1 Tax=Phormidium pseudopriestleyi FRX01 TaxID=1759528 RepID=A0ABS3FTV6_9CYAN|nr:hypothetical protein [Phormidium pseudopriestleyi]MBO0350566.1 hypothetical protein [Phormidium pseudopriestleyi FRX01]